jgi:hypothetical protein
MCVLIFSTTFVWNIFHSKKKWGRYEKMYIALHVKYRLLLADLKEMWIFSTNFRNIIKYQISWKSVLLEPSCSMRTDGHDEAKWSLFAILRTHLKSLSIYRFVSEMSIKLNLITARRFWHYFHNVIFKNQTKIVYSFMFGPPTPHLSTK